MEEKKGGKNKAVKAPAKNKPVESLEKPKQAAQPKPIAELKSETQPKKDIAKKAEKSWLAENKFIVALGIILIIAVVMALPRILPPPEETDIGGFHNNDKPVEEEKLRFIVLYSDKCDGCEKRLSFLNLLSRNNIGFEGNKLEASTLEGVKLVDGLGIKKLPTMLIDMESVSENMVVKRDKYLPKIPPEISLSTILLSYQQAYPDEVKFDQNSNVLVFPELTLDDLGKYVAYLVDGNACLPENEETEARIDVFFDPYDLGYIRSAAAFLNLYEFGIAGDKIEINMRYKASSATAAFPEGTNKEDAQAMPKYIVCADELGKRAEMQTALYANYCSINDNNKFEAEEQERCFESEHFGKPMPESEILEVLKGEAWFDKKDFETCLGNISTKFNDGKSLAEQFYVNKLPMAVTNCKYATHLITMEAALCQINPDLPVCIEQQG